MHLKRVHFTKSSLIVVYYIVQFVATKILEACQQYVVAKQSNLTYWHPVLGCFAQAVDSYLHGAIEYTKAQLTFLWKGKIVSQLIGELITFQ